MGTARLDEIAGDMPSGCVGTSACEEDVGFACVLGAVAQGGVGGGVPLEDKRRRFKLSCSFHLRDAPKTSVV